MLILTRRYEEKIRIGDEITVTVLEAKGGYVRIGINAPKSIAVHREEVYWRKKREEAGSQAPVLTLKGAASLRLDPVS